MLSGIAALLRRRHFAAIVLMALAALMHSIMAAGSVALLAAWLVVEDRRWVVPLGVAAAVAGSAAAGFAPFDRLAIVVDPEWAAIICDHSPQLFLSLWLSGWAGWPVVRAATLLIDTRAALPCARRLFLLAALTGSAAAYGLASTPGCSLSRKRNWRPMCIVFALATPAAAMAS